MKTNPKQCPITAQIVYTTGPMAGISQVRYGDKFVYDGNISMMVYNLRKMIIKNQPGLSSAKIFDNRKIFSDRLIFEAVLIDGNWIVLMNNLASYLLNNYNPAPIGQECNVVRKNYQVEPVKQYRGKQPGDPF